MTTSFVHAAKAVDLLTALHMTGPHKRPMGKQRTTDYRQSRHWGWSSNVVGIGVSRKTAGEDTKGPIAVTIYVRRKFAESRLARQQVIPRELRLPAIGGTVITDLVQLQGTLIGHAPADRIRPLQAGIEAAHEFGDKGTLCAIVRWQQRPGKVFGLGCSHTFARCGIDVNPDADLVEQPQAVADLNKNSVGTLTSNFSTIAFGGPANNFDFAVFEIKDPTGAPSNLIIDQARSIQSVDTRSAEELSSQVETELFGARTQGASGTTLAFHSSWKVGLHKPDGTIGNATFTKVVAYQTDCSEGDSGAPVLEKGKGNLLGMHFAGIQSSRFGLFMPAGPLFTDKGLTLV